MQRFLWGLSWRMPYVAVLAVFLSLGPARANDVTSPDAASAFVRDLGTQTLGLLAGENKTLEQKEIDVRALLADNFALEKIGRFVLGKSWKTASQPEKKEYIRLFSE